MTSLTDFRGKRIACDFADLQPLAESALAEEGIKASEVTFVPWRGSGMEVRHMLASLRDGTVDGVFLIDWNHGDFIAEDMPMRRIPSRLMDAAELSSCLWTMPATLNDPCVAGVCRAMAKATLFAVENPAAVIEMMWEHHPLTRPTEAERARTAARRGNPAGAHRHHAARRHPGPALGRHAGRGVRRGAGSSAPLRGDPASP